MARTINHKLPKVDIQELYAFQFFSMWRAMRSESLSVWMMALYFMFEYVRPQSEFPAIDIAPWSQLVMIGCIITALADKHSTWQGNMMNKLLIWFAIVVLISVVFAFQPAAALKNWQAMAGWVIVYFLVVSVVNTEQRLFLILVAYCLFNLKMAQHGTTTWAGRGFSFAGYGLVGAPGWFRNSGEFAIQMLIYGSLALSLIVGLYKHWSRYKMALLLLLAGMGYMAVIGASSRGAQLALAAIGIWAMLKMNKGFNGLLLILVVAAMLYTVLPDEQLDRFSEMGEDINSVQRLTYWKYALNDVIPDNFFTGVGYLNWMPYINFYNPGGMGPMGINQEVHNIFLQAQSELGILGLLSFIALIIASFVINRRTRKLARKMDNDFLYYVSFGLDAGVVGYLVAGSFVTVLYYPFFWIQIAMIAAVNNVCRNLYEQRFPTKVRRRGPVAFIPDVEAPQQVSHEHRVRD